MPTARLTPADLDRLLRAGAVLGPPSRGEGFEPGPGAGGEGRVRTGPLGLAPGPSPRLSEEDFLRAVLGHARAAGWLCYHTRDARKSAAGFPDIVAVRGDRVWAAELKVGDRRPTAAQTTWLEALRAAGVPAHLWTPADWPAIEEVLR